MNPENSSTRPTLASCREMLRLSWPFILTNSCLTMQIVLDRILLSRSSVEAVGAGMSAVMIFWSVLSLFQWTTNYATTFVAQYTGAGQPRRVGAVIGQAVWFAVFCGLAFLLLLPVAGPIVALTEHSAELQQMEVIYFQCLCFSALPYLLTAAACSFFAGRGDSTTVMIVNVSGLLTNAFWAVVLINGYLGFEKMGIAGAGWATVAGTSVSAILAMGLALLPRHVREYGNGVGWGLDTELLGRLLYYGLPQGVGTALESMAFSAFLLFIGRLGTADLAATSIACTLNLLAFMPMIGVGQAIEVLVGQYLGANRPQSAERAVWTGLIFAVSATLAVLAFYIFTPEWLALPFQTQDDPERWAEVSTRVPLLLRFVALYCLFDCLNIVFAFGLRGAGDTRFVTAVAIVVSWPVMVIPTYLAWKLEWGMYWAWTFASVYVITVALVFLVRFRQGRWKQMRVIEEEAQRREPEKDERISSHPSNSLLSTTTSSRIMSSSEG